MKTLIKNYLNKNHFKTETVDENESGTLIRTGIALKNANCDVFINIKSDPKLVEITTFLPFIIPQEYRFDVCELIVRLNNLLSVGNFDLDLKNGNLSLKTSFLFNKTLTDFEEIFDLNLYISFHFMNKYIPTIMSIIYSNTSPMEAFNNMENIINPELN